MKSSVKKTVKKKYNLYKRYKRTQDYRDFEEYKKQNNKTRQTVRKAQADYENQLMKEFKTKPKQFYSYVRDKQKVKVGVTQLEKEDGSRTESDRETADLLSEFFQSVYTSEPAGDVPTLPTVIGDIIDDFTFTKEDMEEKLNKLSGDKCPGPDQFHPRVLRECSKELSLPLYLIFRKTLDSGSLPADWKTARVTPIFKKGSKTKPGNYRPVSLTCIPCKIMEAVIKDKIQEHVDNHCALSEKQHGFSKGKSCLTNLLETFEEITDNLDRGNGVDIVFLDYQKAFDSVPHRRLLSKLSSYGVGGKILKWIQEFLCGRTQYVAVRKDRSAEAEVTSGVPQGSVLGPLLFIIYINDLPGNVESNAQMFADDTKVFTHINSQDDVKRLQTDMDKLLEWSKTWLLKFNATKCKVMHMGNSNPGGNYTMDGVVLEEIESEKDLGVYITKDSKPSTQCTKAAQKAMNSLRVIKRTFKYFDHDALQTLYRTYIRPHL